MVNRNQISIFVRIMSNDKNIFYRIWTGLVGRHKLSVELADESDSGWSIMIRPWHLLVGFVAMVFIIFAVTVVTIAYTPILDTIPGNPGAKSRQLLIDNIVRLDSLEREMNHLLVYSDNIALIVDGKTPVVRNVEMIGDSVDIKNKEMIPASAADSALRAQIEGTGEYSIAIANAAHKSARMSLDLLPPAQGVVTSQFDPRNGAFGVRLKISTTTISAVKDGTVVANYWSPDEGYVITIQHADNLLSTYKHNTMLQKSIGSHVRAGEVIATVGDGETSDDAENATTEPEVEFELWYKGSPIDPEGYIVF